MSKSMLTTSPGMNPQSYLGSNGKDKMGQTQTTGILKNGKTPDELEMAALLGPESRKKTNNGVAPTDASANDWRKKKDRMALYDL